jgi:hypothetical protein
LETRFKSEFQYISYVADHPDWQLILSLLFQNQPLTLNGHCYFPLMVDGCLIGVIQQQGHALHKLDQDKVAELVELILGSTLNSLFKGEGMQRLEENMRTSTAPAGVVKISDFKKSRNPQSYDEIAGSSEKHQRLLNIPTLMECGEIFEAFKVALEIHEDCRRLAFITYWDLPSSVREDAKELNALGPLTLFLPNPHLLNPREQQALKQHLRSSIAEGLAPETLPHWLSATMISYADLLRHRNFDQQLLKQLSMSFLRIQKSHENLLGSEAQSDLH